MLQTNRQTGSTPPPPEGCVIAIEAIGVAKSGGSIAVGTGEQIHDVFAMHADRPTAAAIGPALRAAVQSARRHGPIARVAVAAGPGSFTGLRIAVTAAKTLAYALNCPAAAVDSMLAIAAAVDWRLHRQFKTAEVLIGAYRGQVIGRRIPLDDLAADRCGDCRPADLMPGGDWTGRSDAATEPTTAAVGEPAAWARWGEIADAVRLISPGPLAVGVLRVAIKKPATDPMALMPVYLRRSAAEEQTVRP